MAEKRKGTFLEKFIIIVLALLCAMLLCAGGFWYYATTNWGSFDRAKLEDYQQSTLVYDNEGEFIRSVYASQERMNISIDTLPKHVVNAFIAAEDLRFYKHFGIDLIRIGGAIINNIRTGSLSQGASTITQQLIKLTHLTPEKKFERKLKEMYYAILVERTYSKDEILEMYLNYVYFGRGACGIEAAAQLYFGLSATELDVAQAACLAAILKSPSYYAPHIDPEKNKTRRDSIIDTMLENGMISDAQARKALAAPTEIIDDTGEDSVFAWFVDAAIDSALELMDIGYQELAAGGYRIYTTLDSDAQSACERALQGYALPRSASGAEPSQCAVIMMEKDGAISALIGGASYSARGLNRATSARRQPGSALKPLAVYSPAIELLGIQTTTYFLDEPKDFGGYAPSNYGGSYYGYVTLRTAFQKSLNIPAVDMMSRFGVDSALQYLGRFSIETTAGDAYLPLALGSMAYGVTPRELAEAYLAFINDGYLPESYMITKIEDSQGRALYIHPSSMQSAVASSTSYLICDMLRSTASSGTARALAELGYPIGAKTGTVDYNGVGNRDAWSVAVTPSRSVCVWMGFDETSAETCLPSSITGGNDPTRLIKAILSDFLPDGDGDFTVPESVVRLAIDSKTLTETGVAYIATQITPPEYTLYEYYAASNRPYEQSPYWQTPALPADFSVAAGASGYPVISFTSAGESARYRIFKKYGGAEEELTAFEGLPYGAQATYTDQNVNWFTSYEYYIVAEHALAADLGVESAGSQSAPIAFRSRIIAPEWTFDF